MFKKKFDKEVDMNSLNDILSTGRKTLKIFYFLSIVAFISVITYLCKEWHVLGYIGDLFKVISPIFIGFLIAWLCDPIVKKLNEKKIPRVLGCILVYLVLLFILGLMGYLLVPSLINQIGDFANSLPEIINDLRGFTDNFVSSLNNSMLNTNDVKESVYTAVEGFAIEFTTDLPNKLLSIGKALFSGGMNVILGLMVGFYLLFDFDKINKNIHDSLPINLRDDYLDLTGRINSSLRSYIQGLLTVMLLVFITQSIGLTIAGLKAPLIFALFCALTDVIPYFGPYIGAIPAVIVGFTMSPIVGVCVIISIVVVQLLENNFYQPLIMGHTMKLHPVTIMVGLLIFEHFFGIIGMIIATPAIACIKVVAQFINEKYNITERVTGE